MHEGPLEPQRTFYGYVLKGDEPGISFAVKAHSLDEARAAAIADYGAGHVMSIWERPRRTYIGFVWVGDQPGTRLAVRARNLDEARAAVEAQYGEGHVTSIWNESDADQPR